MAQTGDPVLLAQLATYMDSKNAQTVLLHALETHVGETTRALLPATPVVLKNLYDNGILSEDVIVQWYDSPGTADVRRHAAPFVTWLKTADEEE